jgi:hypothetical protein
LCPRFFLVTSLPSGSYVRLELFCPSLGAHAWLADWLRRRLGIRRHDGLDENEFTFLYVLLGEITGCMPDGLVAGKAVLECGMGGYHRGPADGVPCSGVSLIGDAIAALEVADQSDELPGISFRSALFDLLVPRNTD